MAFRYKISGKEINVYKQPTSPTRMNDNGNSAGNVRLLKYPITQGLFSILCNKIAP